MVIDLSSGRVIRRLVQSSASVIYPGGPSLLKEKMQRGNQIMGYVEEDLRAIVGQRPLIFVGAVTIIVDDMEQILLQRRRHPYGVWGLPGSLMELGESVEDTARREVLEETGLTIEALELIGVLLGRENFVQVPNGDQFYVVTIAYTTRQFRGTLKVNDGESLGLEFINLSTFQGEIVKSHRKILDMYLDRITYTDHTS